MNMKCPICGSDKFHLDVESQRVSCSSCSFYVELKALIRDSQTEQVAITPKQESAPEVLPQKVQSQADDFEIIGGVLTAYKGKDIDVVVPDGVLEIGPQVFMNMSQIRSIYLPEGLKYVRREAFWGCKNLMKITIPMSLKEFEYSVVRVHYKDSDGDWHITDYKKPRCFWGCVNLTEIIHSYDYLHLHTFEGTPYVENRKKSIKQGVCPQCGGKLSFLSKKCDKCNWYWTHTNTGVWGVVSLNYYPKFNLQGEYWEN